MATELGALESRHPIGPHMPAPLQEDDFASRFVAALDQVLAPIFHTLDNLEAYFDPKLAPPGFVEWIAGWVGLALDENWPLDRQRELTSQAVELYSYRGTIRGVAALVEIYTGVAPKITDSGGVTYSTKPMGKLPGRAEAGMKVTLQVKDPEATDLKRVDSIVTAAKPAHVGHTIEVVSG